MADEPASRPARESPVGGLFDHLVGAGEQRGRHFEAERLGGLDIYYQVEFRRLLDRQVWRAPGSKDRRRVGNTPRLSSSR
jgi:hypothetical protein